MVLPLPATRQAHALGRKREAAGVDGAGEGIDAGQSVVHRSMGSLARLVPRGLQR